MDSKIVKHVKNIAVIWQWKLLRNQLFYLDIFTSARIQDSLIFSVVDCLDLELFLNWHESYPHFIADCTRFKFSKQEETLISQLVKHRHSHGSVSVSRRNRYFIEFIEKGVSSVPAASLRGNRCINVFVEIAIDRYPFNRWDVDRSFEEGIYLIVNEIESLLIPVHFVHLCDNADDMWHTQSLS